MKKQDIALKILHLVGNKENINNVTHCMTRLRFNLKDNKKVDLESIKDLDKVLGAQIQNEQLQIIIGTDVGNYYQYIVDEIGTELDSTGKTSESKGIISKLLEILSGIFLPIIPAIAGAGMLKGILALITTYELLPTDGDTFTIISMMPDTVFYFLPFLLAASAARLFKTNMALSIVLAGAFMHPTILNAASAGEITEYSFFGLSIPVLSYASTVIPIILAVFILKYVFNFVDKYMPDVLKVIFTPTVVLLIMIPLELIVLGPLGNYIGQVISTTITGLFGVSGILAGLILGGLRPFFVLTGMHQAFVPIFFQNLAEQGYDVILPTILMSTFAQAAGAFAMFFKSKDKKEKTLILSASLSAILGITEPALYGVLIRYKKALISVIIGGGIGSAYVSAMNYQLESFATSSIASLPVYAASPGFIHVLIGALLSISITFILTLILQESTESVTADSAKTIQVNEKEDIYSPALGKIIPLAEVNDSTFSSGVMGSGFAIIPKEGVVSAPIDGTVTVVAPTKHAIGIQSDKGTEILVHIGIDTVNLEGTGFDSLVSVGEKVIVGQELIHFDYDKLIKTHDMTIPVVIVDQKIEDDLSISEITTNNKPVFSI